MKRDIYEKMRAEGKTYQSIADEFGVSRQAVFCSIKNGRKTNAPFEYAGTKNVAYPSIKNWLTQNHCSINKLEKLAGCTLRIALKSKTISDSQAYRISVATGISKDEIMSA